MCVAARLTPHLAQRLVRHARVQILSALGCVTHIVLHMPCALVSVQLNSTMPLVRCTVSCCRLLRTVSRATSVPGRLLTLLAAERRLGVFQMWSTSCQNVFYSPQSSGTRDPRLTSETTLFLQAPLSLLKTPPRSLATGCYLFCERVVYRHGAMLLILRVRRGYHARRLRPHGRMMTRIEEMKRLNKM